MNILSLAVASLVDANTNQGYTRQYLRAPADVDMHIQRGRSIRSKAILDLFSKISMALTTFVEESKTRAENRKAVDQLLRMNDHMLRDIGLNYNDVQSLGSGLISLDDLAERRQSDRRTVKSITSIRKTAVDSSIRKIESGNEDCFEFAKCG